MSFHALFASGVHDVKNHLNSAIMNLNEAYAMKNTSRLPEVANHCYELATRLDQLLLMYKFQESAYQASLDYLTLSDLISDSLLECAPIINSRKVVVEENLGTDGDLLIRTDRQLYSIMLNNLIYNAAIWAKSKVTISSFKEDHAFCLEVSDDGDGFPDFMFDVDFSRLHINEDPRLLVAIGTGLYLCAFSAGALTEAGAPCSISLKNNKGASVIIRLENQG